MYRRGQVFKLEVEREVDGRWIADIPELPGCMAYGNTELEARERACELAKAVLALPPAEA